MSCFPNSKQVNIEIHLHLVFADMFLNKWLTYTYKFYVVI